MFALFVVATILFAVGAVVNASQRAIDWVLLFAGLAFVAGGLAYQVAT